MHRYFKKISNTERISSRKSKVLSDEIVRLRVTSDNSLVPALSYIGTKTRVKFDGGCLKQDKITFTHEKVVYNIYKINLWNYVDSRDPTVGDFLFGAAKLVKMLILINTCILDMVLDLMWIGTGGFGKNVIIFEVDVSSSVHVDDKKKDILILGEGPTQGLDDTTRTVEKKYSINSTVTRKKFCLSLHYNRANSYLFVNGTEIIKFKAKVSEINAIP